MIRIIAAATACAILAGCAATKTNLDTAEGPGGHTAVFVTAQRGQTWSDPLAPTSTATLVYDRTPDGTVIPVGVTGGASSAFVADVATAVAGGIPSLIGLGLVSDAVHGINLTTKFPSTIKLAK